MMTTEKMAEMERELDVLMSSVTQAALPAILFAVGGEGLKQEVNVGYARTSEDLQALISKAKTVLLELYMEHGNRPLLVLVPASDELVIESVKTMVRTRLLAKNIIEDLQAAAILRAGASNGKPN